MTDIYFTGVRAPWQPLYETLHEKAATLLGTFEVQASAKYVLWKGPTTFAEISARKDGLVVGFAADALHEEWLPLKTTQTSKHRVAHYFLITEPAELDVLLPRIEAAFQMVADGKLPRPTAPKTSYDTVDAYIAAFPEDIQAILQKVRTTIRQAAPKATEKISWQMPTYHYKENLVHFAAQKSHLGFYPSPEGIEAFADALAPYKTTKGSIQFPFAKPIPYALIEKITRYRMQQMLNT